MFSLKDKYILGYISKSIGLTQPTTYEFEPEQQFIFESIMYSAMTLYKNGGSSKTKLNEAHRRWENELSKKNEEKLSRTQELNTAKVLALKELGYTEINEHNASEVFDKIAEILPKIPIPNIKIQWRYIKFSTPCTFYYYFTQMPLDKCQTKL